MLNSRFGWPLSVIALAVLTPGAAFAATVTLTNDTTVVLPSDGSTYTLASGGTFDNLSVSGGSMTFTMSKGESVTITSPDGYKLNVNAGFAQKCSSAGSTLTLTATGDLDAIVTPVDFVCFGGGSGKSRAPSAPVSATSTTPTASSTQPLAGNSLTSAQVSAILSLLASFNADQSVIAKVNAALSGRIATTTAGTGGAAFTRNLELGDTGADVRALQQYLNGHSSPVAATGPGSAGQETGYFGPATEAALATFQAASKISPTSGYFGRLTRAYFISHT